MSTDVSFKSQENKVRHQLAPNDDSVSSHQCTRCVDGRVCAKARLDSDFRFAKQRIAGVTGGKTSGAVAAAAPLAVVDAESMAMDMPSMIPRFINFLSATGEGRARFAAFVGRR